MPTLTRHVNAFQRSPFYITECVLTLCCSWMWQDSPPGSRFTIEWHRTCKVKTFIKEAITNKAHLETLSVNFQVRQKLSVSIFTSHKEVMCSQRSNAKKNVTSSFSEPWKFESVQTFTRAKFVWKRYMKCADKPNFAPTTLLDVSYFILNTCSKKKKLKFFWNGVKFFG